jgi:hypothetical protein
MIDPGTDLDEHDADRVATDPYTELAELAERELALAGSGLVDEMAEPQARRAALAARLPATPPARARPALERALRASAATELLLAGALEEAASDLSRLHRGRAGVRAYAPGPAPLVDRAG